jgi:hypothetical protein
VRRRLLKLGFRQARRHPRMAFKMSAAAARHPRRTRRLVRFARTVPMDKSVLVEAGGTMWALSDAYRSGMAKARRRARMRKIAVGASVIGAAAYAGRNRRG